MSNSLDFQNQRNKIFARTAETIATKTIRAGADIFKALLNFLKEMLYSFLGK